MRLGPSRNQQLRRQEEEGQRRLDFYLIVRHGRNCEGVEGYCTILGSSISWLYHPLSGFMEDTVSLRLVPLDVLTLPSHSIYPWVKFDVTVKVTYFFPFASQLRYFNNISELSEPKVVDLKAKRKKFAHFNESLSHSTLYIFFIFMLLFKFRIFFFFVFKVCICMVHQRIGIIKRILTLRREKAYSWSRVRSRV